MFHMLAFILEFNIIEKADYPSGIRLVALKRAVVVCFLVREEVATA